MKAPRILLFLKNRITHRKCGKQEVRGTCFSPMSAIAFVVSVSSSVLTLFKSPFSPLESERVRTCGRAWCSGHHIHLYFQQGTARLCSPISLAVGMTTLVNSQRQVGRNYVTQFLTWFIKSSYEQLPLLWKAQE